LCLYLVAKEKLENYFLAGFENRKRNIQMFLSTMATIPLYMVAKKNYSISIVPAMSLPDA
jgi:hypothetical protein